MPKTLLLCVLLASSTFLLAQEQGKSAGFNPSATTLQGCLDFSAHEYRLLDSSGNSTQLQYQANKLIHYVGQQVEISGKPGIETIDTTVDGLASSAEEIAVFDVATVKSAGGTCPSRP